MLTSLLNFQSISFNVRGQMYYVICMLYHFFALKKVFLLPLSKVLGKKKKKTQKKNPYIKRMRQCGLRRGSYSSAQLN